MKFAKTALLALAVLVLTNLPVKAQESVADKARIAAATAPKYGFFDFRAVGAGLVIIGAALGIGMLAKSAVESMARQPEVAPSIQTAMIIAAALIEGVTFFALIIIILQTTY